MLHYRVTQRGVQVDGYRLERIFSFVAERAHTRHLQNGPIRHTKHGYILTADQSGAVSTGIFSYGPIRRRKRGYILMTDQSGAGSAGGGQTGLDTDTVELTVKTLSNHLITLERIIFSHRFFTATCTSVYICYYLSMLNSSLTLRGIIDPQS